MAFMTMAGRCGRLRLISHDAATVLGFLNLGEWLDGPIPPPRPRVLLNPPFPGLVPRPRGLPPLLLWPSPDCASDLDLKPLLSPDALPCCWPLPLPLPPWK